MFGGVKTSGYGVEERMAALLSKVCGQMENINEYFQQI
jgi:hypothetical protein